MNPRFGPGPEQGRRYTRRPGAYAVLWRGGQVLLTHQKDPWPEFQLPGGGIDKGESPVQALHREVFEETGWRINVAQRLGTFRRFTYMPEYDLWAEKVCMIYLGLPVRRLGPPSEPGHSAHWMDPVEAMELVGNDGDAAFLHRAIDLMR